MDEPLRTTTRWPHTLLRVVGLVAAILAALDMAGFFVATSGRAAELLPLYAPAAGALLAAATGVAVLARWPVQSGARSLGVAMAFGAFAFGEVILAPLQFPLGFDLVHVALIAEIGAAGAVFERIDYLALWVAAAAFVRFAATFPRPLRTEDVRRVARLTSKDWRDGLDVPMGGWVARRLGGVLDPMTGWLEARAETSRVARALVRERGRDGGGADRRFESVVRVTTRPRLVWSVALGVGCLLLVVGTESGVTFGAEYLLAIVLPSLAFQALLSSYRVAGPADRRRMLWIIEGFMLGGLLTFVGYAAWTLYDETALVAETLWTLPQVVSGRLVLTLLFGPVALAWTAGVVMAVFYDGALDPGLALRKTTLYGLLGLVVIFVFGAVETILSDHVLSAVGLPSDAGGWIAGGSAALAVSPMQSVLKERVDGFLAGRVPDAVDDTPAEALTPDPAVVTGE